MLRANARMGWVRTRKLNQQWAVEVPRPVEIWYLCFYLDLVRMTIPHF